MKKCCTLLVTRETQINPRGNGTSHSLGMGVTLKMNKKQTNKQNKIPDPPSPQKNQKPYKLKNKQVLTRIRANQDPCTQVIGKSNKAATAGSNVTNPPTALSHRGSQQPQPLVQTYEKWERGHATRKSCRCVTIIFPKGREAGLAKACIQISQACLLFRFVLGGQEVTISYLCSPKLCSQKMHRAWINSFLSLSSHVK